MQTILALWGMARPFIMLSVVLVFALGTLIAWAVNGVFDGWVALYSFVVLLLVSLSIHYVNEYADYETDKLTTPTPFSGGSGVFKRGDVPRELALSAGWVTLMMGLGLAVPGLFVGWMKPAAFGVLVIGAWGGWMYSMPPLKLAWKGWGELDNAVLGGFLLPLYGYAAQTGRIDAEIALGFIPFTLLVFLNLLATTWPDRLADAQVGKFTLATRWPTVRLRRLYLLVAVVAFALLFALKGESLPCEVAYGSLLAIPLVGWGLLRYTRVEIPQASVTAMVVLLIVQMGAWYVVGLM